MLGFTYSVCASSSVASIWRFLRVRILAFPRLDVTRVVEGLNTPLSRVCTPVHIAPKTVSFRDPRPIIVNTAVGPLYPRSSAASRQRYYARDQRE